jgi:hypothetical protein
LVLDILKDRRDLRAILEDQPRKQSPLVVRRYAGRPVEPAVGAYLADVENRAKALTAFVTSKMREGFTSRWRGLILVLAGLAANMVALFASS